MLYKLFASGTGTPDFVNLVPSDVSDLDLPRLFVGNGAEVPILARGASGEPVVSKRRYANLDQAASTPIFKAVLAKLIELQLIYSNIGRGDGRFSQWLSILHERAKQYILKVFGAEEGYQLELVRNASEGSNMASRLLETLLTKGSVIISTELEHHSNLLPWWKVARRMRAKVVHVRITQDGEIDQGDFEAKLKKYGKRVKLVTVTAGSNVSGAVTNLEFFKRECGKAGVYLCVDAAQVAGHRKVTACSLDPAHPEQRIHILVTAGHKHHENLGSSAFILDKDFLAEFWKHSGGLHPNPGGGTIYNVDLRRQKAYFKRAPLIAGTENIVPDILLGYSLYILSERIGWDRIHRTESILLARFRNGLARLNDEIRAEIGEKARIEVRGVPLERGDRGPVIDLEFYDSAGRVIEDAYVSARMGTEYATAGRPLCKCAIPAEEAMAGYRERPGRRGRMRRLGEGGRAPEDLFGAYRLSFSIVNSIADIDQALEGLRAIYFEPPIGDYDRVAATGKYVSRQLPPEYGLPVDLFGTTFDIDRLVEALQL